MTRKVSNFTDLIQRVTTSCLLHPLAQTKEDEDEEEECPSDSEGNKHEENMDEVEEEEDEKKAFGEGKKLKQMEALMEEMFEGVSVMKRAYVRLQEAHCPWEPEKMRVADVAVVAELKKLGVLRERFRRSVDGKGRKRGVSRRGGSGGEVLASLREVVAPYEAVIEELKKEVRAKNLEVQNLREKLEGVVTLSYNGGEKKSGRPQPRRKLGLSQIQGKRKLNR